MTQKHSLRHIFVTILIFVITSCATPYQKQNWYNHTGGYSDEKLADNIFRITFNGNMLISNFVATNYALLRSAEVTSSNGFKYFKIAISNSDTMNREIIAGVQDVLGRPSVIYIIHCYKKKPIGEENNIYDAHKEIEKLKKLHLIAN